MAPVARAARALLVGVGLASAFGCYEPAASDCTVTCSGADECVDGQVCGAVGFCAAPGVTCPPPLVDVQLSIEGNGRISITDVGSCDTREAPDGVCMFSIEQYKAYELEAVETSDSEFITWIRACAGDARTCEFMPVMPLTLVGAKFQRAD